jgi:hypothetical protein
MAKWKYAKPKTKFSFDEYLIIPIDKSHEIEIKNWSFYKSEVHGENKSCFRTDVIKKDGTQVNKILVIKNYDNVIELKKKLAKKTSIKSTAKLKISRHYNEDEMDYYFKIEFLS